MISLILDLKKKIKKWINEIMESLQVVNNKLDYIIGKEDTFMTDVANEFEALRVALDEATNAVGAKIDRLSSQIKTGMTAAEVATLKTGFQAEIDQLKGLAADPADPVPDPVPVPPDPNPVPPTDPNNPVV